MTFTLRSPGSLETKQAGEGRATGKKGPACQEAGMERRFSAQAEPERTPGHTGSCRKVFGVKPV